MRRLDLVVGSNGAGKSTFIELTLAPLLPGSPVVNADEIAKRLWPDAAAEHSYQAARIAADTRGKLIELGESFIAETVPDYREIHGRIVEDLKREMLQMRDALFE